MSALHVASMQLQAGEDVDHARATTTTTTTSPRPSTALECTRLPFLFDNDDDSSAIDSSSFQPTTSSSDKTLYRSNSSASPPSSSHPTTTRKPAPGLAARLRALAFGSQNNQSHRQHQLDVGRIPAEKIDGFDDLARLNAADSIVQRKGQAWTGASRQPPPKIIGDTVTGFRFADVNADTPIAGASANVKWDTRVADVRGRSSITSLEGQDEHTPEDEEFICNMKHYKHQLLDHISRNDMKIISVKENIRHEQQVHVVNDDGDVPPPPLPKDSPADPLTPSSAGLSSTSTDVSNSSSTYFNPLGLQRSGSIYTLSRVSFASQLAQLTSLQLPDASSLSSKVQAIPSSQAACEALMNAAEQIKSWITKASDVLDGLDAHDDVEWAAAGGREGLQEVDASILRFNKLVNVYVTAIEDLQVRTDIGTVSARSLNTVVTQVEDIVTEWEGIRNTLNNVKTQVELALEWEELWNIVLGDISSELDALSKVIFEMEERRHRTMGDLDNNVSLYDIETVVGHSPPRKCHTTIGANRKISTGGSSFVQNAPLSPASPNTMNSHDDSSLLALFARMQPLRASLEFVPMRLATFRGKADTVFPGGCDELESRREALEHTWHGLEKDADALRRELSEDRWILVFRGAGRQAHKTCESVDRSMQRLKDALDNGAHLNDPAATSRKIEKYKDEKKHNGPAIDRLIAIIEKGLQDRLTVNGAIVRMHADLQQRWRSMKDEMVALDGHLDDMQTAKNLRDSISSFMSNDRTMSGSNCDSPVSSPASSIVLSSIEDGRSTSKKSTPGQRAAGTLSLPPSRGRTSFSGQIPSGASTRSRVSSFNMRSQSPRSGSATPTSVSNSSKAINSDNKPRWSSAVKTKADALGFTFNELQLKSPSPYARTISGTATIKTSQLLKPVSPATPVRGSKLPLPCPAHTAEKNTPQSSRASSRAPMTTPRPGSSLGYRPPRITAPGPYSQQVLSTPPTASRLTAKASSSKLRQDAMTLNSLAVTANRRTTLGSGLELHWDKSTMRSPSALPRPGSSLANTGIRSTARPGSSLGREYRDVKPRVDTGLSSGRRSSFMPRGRLSEIDGRTSVLGVTMQLDEDGIAIADRPKWK